MLSLFCCLEREKEEFNKSHVWNQNDFHKSATADLNKKLFLANKTPNGKPATSPNL